MELPLTCPLKMFLLSQLLVFCSEIVYTSVLDANQVPRNLNVSHFDCRALTWNTLYALNKVKQGHITPEELEISQTKIIFYTKHFRKELTECQIQQQREKWHCGHNDHTSSYHTFAEISSDLVSSPKRYPSLAKGKMIYLADHFCEVEFDTKNPIVIKNCSRSGINGDHCDSRDWITRNSFLSNMQRTTLKVRLATRKVLSNSAQLLPCALEEIGCETTSLDRYAYGWDYPDDSVSSVLRTKKSQYGEARDEILYH